MRDVYVAELGCEFMMLNLEHMLVLLGQQLLRPRQPAGNTTIINLLRSLRVL